MTQQKTIKDRNDEIRKSGDFGPETRNPLLVTPGVMALGEDAIAALFAEIMTYDRFDEGDDPENMHDFGTLKSGDTDVWFKIDLSPEHADLRIFTLLLPSEY